MFCDNNSDVKVKDHALALGNCVIELLPRLAESFTPSNIIDPPLALLYVGPLVNAPLFPLLEISLQVVEPDT